MESRGIYMESEAVVCTIRGILDCPIGHVVEGVLVIIAVGVILFMLVYGEVTDMRSVR